MAIVMLSDWGFKAPARTKKFLFAHSGATDSEVSARRLVDGKQAREEDITFRLNRNPEA